MRLIPSIIALAAAFLGGCKSAPPAELSSVFIEVPAAQAMPGSEPVKLPVSGLPLFVAPKAVVMAEKIAQVAVVTAGDNDLRQHYVMVTLDGSGTQDLALLSRDAGGRSLVLVIGSEAVGIMRMDRPIGDGRIFFHVEQRGMSNAEAAFAVAGRIEKMIAAIAKAKDRSL
ncbi:MAG: hypothetical protein ACKORB_01385 [Opitutia bacterium]